MTMEEQFNKQLEEKQLEIDELKRQMTVDQLVDLLKWNGYEITPL